jgi:benzoyl-CoA reductase subunit B
MSPIAVAEQGPMRCTPIIRQHQKEWFQELRRRVLVERQPYAIAEAVSPHEILESFDMPYVTSEWWSGIVASRRQSAYYFDHLEAAGYHSGLPRYGALALATAIAPKEHEAPWGGLPQPALVVGNLNMTPGDAARAQALAEAFNVPQIVLSTPALSQLSPYFFRDSKRMWETLYETPRLNRMVADYHALIEKCEQITGKRFDVDRLREILARANRQEEYFAEVRDMIVAAPFAPISLTEELGNVMTIQWHRGSQWALEAARMFRDEVAERVAGGVAICPTERIRLMWGGTGLWQNTAFYRAFEASHGAVFVRSVYMSVAIDGYIRYGLKDPIRALASRYAAIMYELRVPPAVTGWTVEEAKHHRVKAAIMGPGGSPHHYGATSGSSFTLNALEAAGIPAYRFEVDTVDGRQWREEEILADVRRFLDERVVPHL